MKGGGNEGKHCMAPLPSEVDKQPLHSLPVGEPPSTLSWFHHCKLRCTCPRVTNLRLCSWLYRQNMLVSIDGDDIGICRWEQLHKPGLILNENKHLYTVYCCRRGQAAPPYFGCWTTLDLFLVPPLQGALQLLQRDQSPTLQSTVQTTCKRLLITVMTDMVIMTCSHQTGL